MEVFKIRLNKFIVITIAISMILCLLPAIAAEDTTNQNITVTGNNSNLINTSLSGNDGDIYYGGNFDVDLKDDQANPLSNKTIEFICGDKNYSAITNENGTASIKIDLDIGNYNITSIFRGDANYSSINLTNNINLMPTIISQDIVKYYKNDTQFYATILDSQGNALTYQNVTFLIYDKAYNRSTNGSGVARLNINLDPGVYNITVVNLNNGFNITNKVTVLSQTIGKNIVKYYKNGTQFYVTILDDKGNPLINKSVTINIYGVFYDRLTNGSGVARLNINLYPGEYIATVYRDDTDLKRSYNISVLSTIEGNNVVKYYKNDTQFYVTILDDNGNPLVDMPVTINIYGVFYDRLTNGSGVARLNINLHPGKYIATVSRPDSDLLRSYEIIVLSTIEGQDVVKTYKNDTQFHATILDNEGYPLPNTNITINIYGVFYIRETNENGTVTLNINLNPGEYIATVIAPNGEHKSFKITVLSNIITRDIVVGVNIKNYFNAVIKDDEGNPLEGVNVNFRVNGRSYDILTDVNGVASLSIFRLSQTKGTYTIVTSYGGESVTNTILVTSGYTYSIKSIGNISSNVHIAYIVGVHPKESATHDTLLKILPKTENLSYCYDIYVVNVTETGLSDDAGRLAGQILAHDYVVPLIKQARYNLVIDVHSNVGAWVEDTFVFSPKVSQTGLSVTYAKEVAGNTSYLSYFIPPQSTSPAYVTLPIIYSNIPAFIFEEYTYSSQLTKDLHIQELIQAVDQLYIKFF